MSPTKAIADQPLLREFPLVYEGEEPTAVLVDINVFKFLLERLEELEDRELIGDPNVIARLREARADHLAGRTISHGELIERRKANELAALRRFRGIWKDEDVDAIFQKIDEEWNEWNERWHA